MESPFCFSARSSYNSGIEKVRQWKRRGAKMDLRGLFAKGNDEREYTVTDRSGISRIGTNRILGDTALLDDADKLSIVFRGSGNILFLEKGIKHLRNVDITFSGDNSLIYISKSKSEFTFKIEIEDNAACFFGPHLYTSKMKALSVKIRSGDTFLTGTDCLFSLAINIDTMNPEENGHSDILIGNHVWIGQNVKIYGGSVIHSGTVLGAQTVVEGSECSGNACWVTRKGELTKIADNTVFTKDSMRAVEPSSLEKFDHMDASVMEQLDELPNMDEGFELAERFRQIPSASARLKHIRRTASKRMEERAPQLSGQVLWDEEEKPDAEDGDNRIIGAFDASGGNEVIFKGKGNTLFIEDGVKMDDCRVYFNCDNSLVYLSKSERPYHFRIFAHYDSTVYFGNNVRFPERSPARINVSEAKSVLIGSDVRIGKRVWMRTSDQHPIYDIESGRRINNAKSIVIGDGARVANDTVVRKGSVITGSGNGSSEKLIKAADEIDRTSDLNERLELLKIINNA